MILNGKYKMFSEMIEEDFKIWGFKKLTDFHIDDICPSSPDSSNSDFSDPYGRNWDNNDFLECVKYDEIELEKNPAFFTCVSPVHLDVLSNNERPESPDIDENSLDLSASVSWQQILDSLKGNDFTDEFINEIAKVEINQEDSLYDQELNSALAKPYYSDSGHSAKVDTINVSFDSIRSAFNKPYHLDFDHCYSAPPKVEENEEEEKFSYWDSSPCSPDSSETSSEEVDVVTVPEELIPIVPKVEPPIRITRKRGRKSTKKTQSPLSAKSLKAAMKNSRITNVRRTYRRKVSNSVETSPSNSVPSSAQSSRCNSDNEDAGKRANHNSSERKRREILRTALQTLRKCVPSTENNPKAPKVLILNSAKDYINQLINKEQDLKFKKRQEDQRRKHKEAELKSLMAYFRKHC